MGLRLVLCALGALISLVAVPVAGASSVVTTFTATGLKLTITKDDEAILSYHSEGKDVHVLAWGAVNALAPTPGGKQVDFRYDYSGGYSKYYTEDPDAKAALKKLTDLQAQFKRATTNAERWKLGPQIAAARAANDKLRLAATNYWQTGTCEKYDGPSLAWMVAACKGPDGSYWAVQSWQRKLPDYGLAPNTEESQWEVYLSHWTGPLPVLTISTDWAWHQWDHLYGTFTYDGKPVYGFKATPAGQPLDTFGRNVYVDTLDSAYGSGWKRENSFLTHSGDGVFCYSVNPHGSHPSGKGTQYRATILGPGVTPDVEWQGASPGTYDATADAAANQLIAALGDKQCQPN
ncbi:MAG: hypothetical protein JO017_00035 [Actinobacteria bacterium]|nr:hypothetical protein [Actinomycetota bacterium]